ncbi:hypothetical protein ACFL5O_12185 [Myxococcota bacterium]
MSEVRGRWAAAFLRQGRSDLMVYHLLSGRPEHDTPSCHALHYLQMACEKIAKAYRIRDTNAELAGEGGLLRRHVGFGKFMRTFLLSPAIREAYAGRTAQLGEVSKRVLSLARELEKLALAVDQQVSPENAEYPWEADGQIVAPCDYGFSRLSLLREPGGALFLKFLGRAVEEFETVELA